MNKKGITTLVVIIAIIVVGFYFFGSSKDDSTEKTDSISAYFQEQMISRGIADIGHPIEGFDANLLVIAFPGLLESDFHNVKSFEGHYEYNAETLEFVREQAEPVSSAEQTISDEGFATLLQNLEARLEKEIQNESDVDTLINSIDLAETLSLNLDEKSEVLGVSVTVLEVLEDSRCPIDVTCIQAGTVRVRTLLTSGLGEGGAEQIFELFSPVTTEVEEVELIQVMPLPESTVEIEDEDYVFSFRVSKR